MASDGKVTPFAWSRSTTRSARSSLRMTLAGNSLPSDSATVISASPLPSMTWLLVTATPSGLTITPEPSEFWIRSRGMPKLSPNRRLKNGSLAKGETTCLTLRLT